MNLSEIIPIIHFPAAIFDTEQSGDSAIIDFCQTYRDSRQQQQSGLSSGTHSCINKR